MPFLFSRLILIIIPHDVVNQRLLLGDITSVGRYSKWSGRCLAAVQSARSGAKEPRCPIKGCCVCLIWDDCLRVRRLSRLGHGALIAVLEMRTNQGVQTLCCKMSCFLKVAPGAFGLGTCELI